VGTSGPADIYTYNDFGFPASGNWADYRFAGYRYDNETGLYYTQTRHYSPNLGRFLQPDSLGIEGGANLYAYVNNDPANATDPSGKCPSCLIGGLLNVGIGYGISRLTGQEYSLGSAALDFGIGFATGGFAALSAAARGAEIVEGIYVVETVAGETYVGQSGNVASRLAQHVFNGKITQEAADAARLFEVLGGKASREVAEQAMIDALGGIEELANIVNPIGGRPWLANNPALGNILSDNLINWYNVIASDIGIDALTRLLRGQGHPPK
jgi:RHS repeat-associated protein